MNEKEPAFTIPPDLTLLPEVSEDQLRKAVSVFLAKEPDYINTVISKDPALSSKPRDEAEREVLLYQGLHAIALHRQASEMYHNGNFLGARSLSQAARRTTGGIEIHPGARIGKNFFIDHGSGVVIGETAEIGDNVMLYHRVTLGSDAKTTDGNRRHPKIGNNVTISTGAEVLGPATIDDDVTISAGTKVIGKVHIGANARIAPHLVIRKDVPENATVVDSDSRGNPIFTDSNQFDLAWGDRIYPRNKKAPRSRENGDDEPPNYSI